MREIEISARTVEEATELALKELDADRSDVEIDVVSRGKAGILGIGAEPAVVRATLVEALPENVTIAAEVIESLIYLMDVDAMVTMKQAFNEGLGGPVFEIEGDDAGLLIGRKGETLNTFQFLVRYIVSHRIDGRARLMIDVEGYQQRRYQSLENMAYRVARRVADTGRSISLEPMPAADRRIIHVALTDHPVVTTESMGYGEDRQVVVMLR